VAADSHCPFTALDDDEIKERVSRLHNNQNIDHKKFLCSAANIGKANMKYRMSDDMRKHTEAAINQLAESKESHQSLEDWIFLILKELEVDGNATKNERITRATAKQFVDQVVIHAQHWVHVKRGRNTAVSFNSLMLGTAMNNYLRSPVAYSQMRSDDCFIQPSPSWQGKLKSK